MSRHDIDDPAIRGETERRITTLTQLPWSIKPRESSKLPDTRCEAVEDWFKHPDGIQSWRDWLRQLLEGGMTGAACVWIVRDTSGQPSGFGLIDSDTVRVALDDDLRTPAPPAVAYQQVRKGKVVEEYTTDDLIYEPCGPNWPAFVVSVMNRLLATAFGYADLQFCWGCEPQQLRVLTSVPQLHIVETTIVDLRTRRAARAPEAGDILLRGPSNPAGWRLEDLLAQLSVELGAIVESGEASGAAAQNRKFALRAVQARVNEAGYTLRTHGVAVAEYP